MSSTHRKRRSSLLKYHRPKLSLDNAPIPQLKPESKRCLQNLLSYRPLNQMLRFPKTRCAAVLVALFIGRMGDLYVLLSQRASGLRTYAGDTSLPGGKWEPQDRSMEWTARREAFEEIGLPLDRRKVPLLCVMEPFLAGGDLLVTPVVVLVLDNGLRPVLNEAEVALLFSHPLASLLSVHPPFPPDSLDSSQEYYTYKDIPDISGLPAQARMHRFLTGREAGGTKPIFGLTAAILIHVAAIGYAHAPEFQPTAPGQYPMEDRIAYALKTKPKFREAMEKEGIDINVIPDVLELRSAAIAPRALKSRL